MNTCACGHGPEYHFRPGSNAGNCQSEGCLCGAYETVDDRAKVIVDKDIAVLWGHLCPDIGPDGWNALVRWVAMNVNAQEHLRALERVAEATRLFVKPTGDGEAQFEEMEKALAALDAVKGP